MAQKPVSTLNHNESKFSLIDCYRVALDYGLPAAEHALNKIAISVPLQKQSSSLINSGHKVYD